MPTTPRPELIDAMIHEESGGRPSVTGPDNWTGENAQGLMQVMPSTAKDYGVDPSTLKDPNVNRQVGTRYMGDLLDKYQGNERAALIAYNQGPGKYDRGERDPAALQYADNVLARSGGRSDDPVGAEQAYAARHADDSKVDYGMAYLRTHPDEWKSLGIALDAGGDAQDAGASSEGTPVGGGRPSDKLLPQQEQANQAQAEAGQNLSNLETATKGAEVVQKAAGIGGGAAALMAAGVAAPAAIVGGVLLDKAQSLGAEATIQQARKLYGNNHPMLDAISGLAGSFATGMGMFAGLPSGEAPSGVPAKSSGIVDAQGNPVASESAPAAAAPAAEGGGPVATTAAPAPVTTLAERTAKVQGVLDNLRGQLAETQSLHGQLLETSKNLPEGIDPQEAAQHLATNEMQQEKLKTSIADMEGIVNQHQKWAADIEAGKQAQTIVTAPAKAVDLTPDMIVPEHATPLAAAQTLAQKQADLFKKLQVGEGGAAEVNRPDLATQVPVAQTMANAKKLGLTMEQLKAQNIGDPEQTMRVAALAQTVHGEAIELRNSALDILKRQAAGEDVTADSQAWFNRVSALAPQAGRVAGERSAAGRTLQILDPLKNPETAMASAVNRFALQAGDGQNMTDMMQMFAGHADPDAIAAQLGKMNENVQAGGSLKGAISDYYYGALLSRPRTLVKKATGDLWSMALSIPTRQIAAMTSSDVAPTEAPAMVNAWMHNVGDALRIAGKTWKSGTSEFDRLYPGEEAAFERPLTQITSTGTRFENTLTGQGIDLLGHVIGLGPRSMGGLQDFARTMNMRAQVAALAERQGWKEAMDQGLSGGEAGNFIKQRVADLTNDTPPEMLANARNFASTQTYSNPLGPVMQGISDSLDKIPLGLGRFLFPFRRVPTNLWKFARDNSALGVFSKQIWQDMQAGGADGAIAKAKLGLGTLMSVKMGQWAMDGHITGGGPSDPKLLSDLKATGWKPYSFHIGDSYIPYGWAEPVSMPLGIAADMHDTYAQATPGDREQQLEHVGAAFAMAMARNLSRQSYVQTFVNLSSLFDDAKEGKDPLEGVTKFGGRELKGLIPAALQGEAKREDPIMRQTRGMMDEFKAGTPGYSQELPPVRDLYGEKIPVPGGFMANEVWPFSVGHDTHDPVAKAIYDNGASPMKFPAIMPGTGRAAKYGDQPNSPDVGVALTPQEQDRGKVLTNTIKDPSTGMNMREALNALVADPQFKSAPRDERAKALEHVVTGFTHGAIGSLYAESADVRQRYAARMKYREMAHQPAPSGGITPASATAPSL